MATGEDVLKIAGKHVGERYILGALAPKNNADWRGPWDCAEFTSWCVFQAASVLYGCDDNRTNPARADAFTGFWARDARALGRKIPVAKAARIPGAAVLRISRGARIGHIVFSDGLGGTVEAHSTRQGVKRDTLSNRRWDTGILVPGIDYNVGEEAVLIAPPPKIFRLTSPLMRGPVVRRIQTQLKAKGFNPGPIDGVLGSK
ncbi:MAG: peptidoglycan-binding protein, partial [Pyrinomonadaceae bacterium]